MKFESEIIKENIKNGLLGNRYVMEGIFDMFKKKPKPSLPQEIQDVIAAMKPVLQKFVGATLVFGEKGKGKSGTGKFSAVSIEVTNNGVVAIGEYNTDGCGKFRFTSTFDFANVSNLDKLKPTDKYTLRFTLRIQRNEFRDEMSMLSNTDYDEQYVDQQSDVALEPSIVSRVSQKLYDEVIESVSDFLKNMSDKPLPDMRNPARISRKNQALHLIGIG